MPLDLGNLQLTYEKFINILLNVELASYQTLKVACYLTEYEKWDDGSPSLTEILKNNGFQLEPMGELRKGTNYYFYDDLIKEEEEDQESLEYKRNVIMTCYFYLESSNKVLYVFTDSKIDVIKKIFGRIVNYEQKIYSLFVGTSAFNYLINKIIDIDETSKCVYFTAKHLPSYFTKGRIRPDKERTIVYYGMDGDGVKTMQEMKEMYGVLPRIMRFRMDDIGVFEIQNIGVFTAQKEYDSETARIRLLEIVKVLVEYVLKQKQILVDSKYEIVQIKTRDKIFNIPKINPWLIKFDTYLDDSSMNYIFDVLNGVDFPIYNYVSETGGSFRINGIVIDGRKNSKFAINMNNAGILVSPLENCNFDTFLRFFEAVVENIEPQSDIKEVT